MSTIRTLALSKLERLQRSLASQIDKAYKKNRVVDALALEERYRQIALRIEMLHASTQKKPNFR